MARSGVLIIFTRKPVAGETKTRLIPALGAEGAARLHRKLLMHTVDVACRSDFASCEIHVYPDEQHDFLQLLSSQFDIGIHAQRGSDLGERMHNAVGGVLQQYDFVVITGCDIPLLDLSVLNHAHDILLQQQADAVMGPAEDGGYYLIGMDNPEPFLFQDISWGTTRVLSQTTRALKACDMCWKETARLWDVDVPDDLEKLDQVPGFRSCQENAI